MSYTKSTERLQQDLTFLKNFKLNSKIIVGLRAWNDGSSYPAKQITEKMRTANKLNYAGFALFSYTGIKQEDYFKNLKLNK